MKFFTVLGCVTDIAGAQPYLCQPARDGNMAVEAWYVAACDNINADPDAFPPESAEHEALLDMAHALRTVGDAFLDGEALALHSFELAVDAEILGFIRAVERFLADMAERGDYAARILHGDAGIILAGLEGEA